MQQFCHYGDTSHNNNGSDGPATAVKVTATTKKRVATIETLTENYDDNDGSDDDKNNDVDEEKMPTTAVTAKVTQ